MSQISHHHSQRAASVSTINSESPSTLFPPFRTEGTSDQEATSGTGQRSGSRSASKSQARDVIKLEPRSAWRKYTHFFLDVLPQGWALEYISCLISLAAFMSMIVVLHEYDGKGLPSWPLGITINTLIAFLTAVSQSTFVFPVVQGLSQMKWVWFMAKNRPLEDFERFDNASRGAWGSILLLFSTKGRLSVLLAAILLVTSAVTSTITQAVLSQSTRYVSNNQNATIYRMIHDGSDYTSSINQMTGYMISAMFTSGNTTYNFTEPECPTGNCQWPSFGSLAVCVETNDITDKLVFEETAVQCCTENATNRFEGWTWQESCTNCTQIGLAQNEYFWLKPHQDISLNSTSITLDGLNNPYWSYLYTFTNESFGYNALTAVQTIYLNTTDAVDFGAETLNNTQLFLKYARAVESLFYMCVETYNVTTTNGTTFTNVTSTTSNVTWFDQYGALADSRYPTIIDNRTFTVDGLNYSYYDVSTSVSEIIQNSLLGSYNYIGTYGLFDMTPFSYSLGTAIYKSQNINATAGTTRDKLMLSAVDNVLSNTARGMTNWLRSFFASPVVGQSFVSDSYIVVRWPYLIFLAVQIFLSVVFLIWVILDSKVRKVDSLKDSVITSLFAISAEDRARFDTLDEKPHEREEVAKASKVTLVKNGSGQWNLKLIDPK